VNDASLTTPETAPVKRPTRVRRAAMTMTPAAVARVRHLLAKRDEQPAYALRVGIRSRGCSGMSYTVDYADSASPGDEVIEIDDVRVLIDPKASMFLFGTEMDYVEEQLQSGFVFRNPNEKGRCGCGESFHV
jgi:iron-sulfur cluster assembly protein